MTTIAADPTLEDRVDALDWDDLHTQLDDRGFAITPPLLEPVECAELSDLFDGGHFRSTVDMARHRFGDGRYRSSTIRSRADRGPARRLLPAPGAGGQPVVGAARRRRGRLSLEHAGLLERCREAGQERPTPLILRYGADDWNALHQDLYGDVYFPFQALTVLSDPDADFEGGQFVLVEQRPRAQSRAHVLTPRAARS